MHIVIASPFARSEEGVLGMYAEELQKAFIRVGHTAEVLAYGIEKRLPFGIRHLAFFVRIFSRMRKDSVCLALDTISVGVPAFYACKLRGAKFTVRLGGDFLWESYVERTKQSVRLSDFYTDQQTLSAKEKMIFSLTRQILKKADALFFTTHFLKEIWEKAYGFNAARAHIVENYYPPRTEEKRSIANKRVFVSAGRPIALKNYTMLEKVFAVIKSKYPDIELDMRRLPPEEHHARLKSAYAVIIPSISEVSSNTAVDAVHAGIPFVMTDDTGTKERLGACGLFIDTRSEQELEKAIESVLQKDTYNSLQKSGESFIFMHTWDDIAREMLAHL